MNKEALITMLKTDIDWDETFYQNSLDFADKFAVADPLFLAKIKSITFFYNYMSIGEMAVIDRVTNPASKKTVEAVNKLVMTAGFRAGIQWTNAYLNDLNNASITPSSSHFINELANEINNLQESAINILAEIESV